jgi:hypothetical protein
MIGSAGDRFLKHTFRLRRPHGNNSNFYRIIFVFQSERRFKTSEIIWVDDTRYAIADQSTCIFIDRDFC